MFTLVTSVSASTHKCNHLALYHQAIACHAAVTRGTSNPLVHYRMSNIVVRAYHSPTSRINWPATEATHLRAKHWIHTRL